jgi:hypothetical protein
MKKIILLIALLQFGCASKFFISGNRFLIPESSGSFLKGDFKVGGAGVTQVQVADDITAVNPDTTPQLSKNSSVALGLQIGLVNRIDLYLTGVSGAADIAGLKVQLLGDSNPTAKAHNFSLAVAGGANFGTISNSNNSSSVSANSKIKLGGYEALALMGYRFSDGFLFYLSPFASTTTANVKIERTVGDVTTTSAQPDGTGTMNGATVGVRFGKSFFLNAEVSVTDVEWTRTAPTELKTEKFTDSALGIALGGTW